MSAIFDISKDSRHNPFIESPVQQSFYHPSVARPVEDSMKQAGLSVEGKSWEVCGDLTPSDDQFLKASLYYTSKFPRADGVSPGDGGSSKFNESWPDSEKPSSLSVSGNVSFGGELYPAHSQMWTSSPLSVLEKDALRDKRHMDHQMDHLMDHHVPERDTGGPGVTDGSVLSKYIDRFRHGTPLSREERERVGTVRTQDFWWLSGDNVRGSYDGLKSRHLEEKADRLLQRTVSSLGSSEPIVSTDGLGSSLSETPNSLHEEPYRPVFTRTPVTERVSRGPVPRRQPLPEDDILAQWRLRCKMEEARHTTSASHRQTESHGQMTSLSKPGSFSAKLDDSTDLRLAEFRRRLASGRLVDATAMTTDRSPSGQELDQHMLGTAVDTARRPRVPALGTAGTVPVASPSVPPGTQWTQQGEGEGEGEDVAPHLHLSCDILQCRHESHDHRQTEGDTWRQRPCDRTHTRVCDVTQRREVDDVSHPPDRPSSSVDPRCPRGGDGHSGRHTGHPGHGDQRGDTDDDGESDSCTDRSDRSGRVKHRPTRVTSHGDVSRDKETHTDQLVRGDVSRHVDSDGQRSRPVGGRRKGTRRGSRRQTGPEPEREGHVGVTSDGDVTSGEEDTAPGQKATRKLSRREGAGDRLVRGCDATTGDRAGVTGETRRSASETTAARRPDRHTPTGDDVDGLGRSTRPGGRGGKSGKTSQTHPARSKSSPTRSITSAIGQVVGSQLFGSSASLTSSVDSDLARPLSPVTSPPDLAAALWSDSEEFADDEVLVDLRNRRAAYLRRLANVNTALKRIT